MTKIPSTDIDMTEIAAEFPRTYNSQGDAPPHSMSEFRGVTANVPSTGAIKFSDFANEEGIFTLTATNGWQQMNVATAATNAGWDGVVTIKLVIPAGKYIWSDNTAVPAITTGTIARGLIIENNGFIMGKGGKGYDHPSGTSESGGIAMNMQCNVLLINNGYIGGGGGGGAGGGVSGGGGGAGGGLGGTGSGGNGIGGAGGSTGQAGANGAGFNGGTGGTGGTAGGGGATGYARKGTDAWGGGAGGGRIMPGSTTLSAGGSGGGPEVVGGSTTGEYYKSAGGGGWGADGGSSSSTHGTGGAAINRNGYTLVITTGSDRIYGAY